MVYLSLLKILSIINYFFIFKVDRRKSTAIKRGDTYGERERKNQRKITQALGNYYSGRNNKVLRNLQNRKSVATHM